jgi:hypothetical protein
MQFAFILLLTSKAILGKIQNVEKPTFADKKLFRKA